MAWRSGADPYRLYNSLDEQYRPLTHRHPCPLCYAVRPQQDVPTPCKLCGWKHYVEIPLDEPGEPRLPPRPSRIRTFIFGCASGLADLEGGERTQGR